ncbi:putative Ig domain-containing protein [Deinococcus sp.]|uniref:putative Ig domain-containing protein n=1 Tax=Deinococcus sp. TaxID=47478 RepID=UPI003CC6D58E
MLLSLRPPTLLLVGVLACGLVGCGSTNSTNASTSTRDPLTFASSNVPVAYVGESYTTSVQVAGGAGPYTLRLASGKLPDGLTLSGQTISGKPSKEGLSIFILEVSDAALSTKTQQISLNVTALPPLSLALGLPTSEIRGETRLPLSIAAPRATRALRFQWALPPNLSVSKVTPTDTRSIGYWKVTDGLLTLDLGFKSVPGNGAQVALISVKPDQPLTLGSPQIGYSAYAADGKAIQAQALPSASSPIALGTATSADAASATPAGSVPAPDAPVPDYSDGGSGSSETTPATPPVSPLPGGGK